MVKSPSLAIGPFSLESVFWWHIYSYRQPLAFCNPYYILSHTPIMYKSTRKKDSVRDERHQKNVCNCYNSIPLFFKWKQRNIFTFNDFQYFFKGHFLLFKVDQILSWLSLGIRNPDLLKFSCCLFWN
jgi:hypothetical protein